MRIYDISREIFSSTPYEGDPAPETHLLRSVKDGHPYSLSSVSMCLHTATHIDAPSHYLEDGKAIDELPLKKCIGPCMVLEAGGVIDEGYIAPLLGRGAKRLLFKGKGVLTPQAARLIAESEVIMIGTENPTVGYGEHVHEIHRILLEKEILPLEGLNLKDVPEGNYYLVALPLKLEGVEGSPCRAVLMDYLPATVL